MREQIAQTDGVPKGMCLRELSSRPERHLLQSSARVSNERNERHARGAEP